MGWRWAPAVFSGVATAQQSPVPGMSSDDLNTALDFAKAGLNKAIDQARAYSALPIKDPHDVRYTCEGGKTLLVKYMTVGDTPLAAMTLNGKTLVFANVMAASGARYASGQYGGGRRAPPASSPTRPCQAAAISSTAIAAKRPAAGLKFPADRARR
ncbi:MliC family protein [Cupriavidus basilensis]